MILLFNYPYHLNFAGNDVRTVAVEGEPWFVAQDVCRVLGLSNTSKPVSVLDDDEKDKITISDSIGRGRNKPTINESGMYPLVMKSRKPEAKRFRKWVTGEVLPTIRKTVDTARS